MAQFDRTGVEGIPSAAAPAQPIVDTSKAQSTANLASGIQQVGELATGILDAFTESKAATALADFSTQQLKLADAVDQGLISSKEARMKMRSNFVTATANSPRLLGEIQKIHGDIVSTAGLGKVIAEGTEEERLVQEKIDDAFKSGWILPDFSNQEEGLAKFLEFEATNRLIKEQDDRIKRAQSKAVLKGTLTSNQQAELNLEQDIEADKAKKNMASLADTYSHAVKNKLETIVGNIASGQLTVEQGVLQAQQNMFEVESLANQVGTLAGTDYTNDLIKPMSDMTKQYIEFFKGNVSKTVLDNQLSNTLTRQKLMLVGDEETAKLIAISQLVGNASTVVVAKLDAKVLDAMRNNSGNGGKISSPTGEGMTGLLPLLQESAGNLANGRIDPNIKTQVEKEWNVQFTNLLRGVDIHQLSVESPDEYNAIVKFLADPSTNKQVVNQGGIPGDVVAQAQNVLREQYANKVMPVVKESYINALSSVGRMQDPSKLREGVSDVITPVFSGTGVVFQRKEGVPAGIYGAEFTVKQLNKEVAPVLNRLIRMDATLSGTSNFKKVWEDRYMPILIPKEAVEPEVAPVIEEPPILDVISTITDNDKMRSRLSLATEEELKVLMTSADPLLADMAKEFLDEMTGVSNE